MKTEDKILRTLLDHRESKTIRELSKHIQADYRITHTATKKLIEKNILLFRTVGKSTLCEINPNYYGAEIYNAEDQRREKILKDDNLRQLYKEIMGKATTSLFICLLFGSYAKGTQTKHSDIDLLFITNEKQFEEQLSTILSTIPLKTHILVFSEKEYKRMQHAKEGNVIKEAMKNNIILYGVEQYYKLKNA